MILGTNAAGAAYLCFFVAVLLFGAVLLLGV